MLTLCLDWQASHGIRSSHSFVLTAGTLSSSSSQILSFDSPSASSVQSWNAARTQSTLVLLGLNFGISRSSLGVRIALTNAELTNWISNTAVSCTSASGVGDQLRLQMTAGAKTGTMSFALTYDVITLSSIARKNFIAAGGLTATMFGSGFAAVHYTAQPSFGRTQCESTVWVSNTFLKCKSVSGIGASMEAGITVARQRHTFSESISFDTGHILQTLSVRNHPDQLVTVTMKGSSLGLYAATPSSRIGQSHSITTVWTSDTSVACYFSPKYGSSMSTAITAGVLVQSISQIYSYDGPSVHDPMYTVIVQLIQTVAFRVGMSNFPTLPSAHTTVSQTGSMFVVGSAFGGPSSSNSIRVGLTAAATTSWLSATHLRCKVMAGTHASSRTVATVGFVRAGSASEFMSFEGPFASSITLANFVKYEFLSKSISVLGQNFGIHLVSMGSRITFTRSEASSWLSETATTLRASESLRASQTAIMTAGQKVGTFTEIMSFDRQQFSNIHGANQRISEFSHVTIQGLAINAFPHSRRAAVGSTPCESTRWISWTSMYCKEGRGGHHTSLYKVTAGQRVSSVSAGFSIDLSAVSVVSGFNIAGSGFGMLTLHGTGFGEVRYSLSGRPGSTSCPSTDWKAETALFCNVGGGTRGTHHFVLTAGMRGGSVSQSWSVDKMSLLGVSQRSNVASSGSILLTISGAGMLTTVYTSRSRVGRTTCESTVWISSTSTNCRSGRSERASLHALVTAGVHSSSMTQVWSSDTPQMSVIKSVNGGVAAASALSMTVHGSGMAVSAHTARARKGITGCEATVWISPLSLTCRVAHILHGTRQTLATLTHQIGSLTQAWSADKLPLSSVASVNGGVGAYRTVSVLGRNMGITGASAKIRVQQSACESTEWVSETSVRCRVGQAVAGSRQSVMTVGDRAGSLTEAWSVDVAGLSAVGGINQQSVGAKSMTVHGARMGTVGYTGRSRAGRSGCESTEWVSETSVRCRVGQAVAGSRQSVMTVGDRAGSLTEAWSVDVAGLSAVGGINQQSVGAKSMTVHGARMGTVGYTGRSRAGRSGCESTEWVSETSVRCRVGQAVAGSRQSVMTVGDRAGSLTEAWSVDVAGLSAVGGINQQSVGAKSMTVHGARMGTVGYTGRSRAGRSGCESTEWVSETSVRCRVGQAVAGSRQSVMTVGDRAGSLTEAWSVDVAGLSAVGGINQQSMGAKSMTVHGARMGTVGYTGRSRAGRSGCESTEWVSETSVRCRVGQAVAGSRQSVMTVGDRAGSLTEAWSVDVAGLSAVGGINQQSVGAKSMTVHGARMGTVGYTGRSRAGRSGCESTEWVSETSVRCRVGQAVAGSRQSVMTVGDRAGSLTEAWSVDVAGLSAVGGINQQSVGAKSMTVHGARMGTVGYTGRSRAGRSGCESTEWVSETSVRCRVGQAVAGSRQSVMTVGDRAGSLTEAWSVDVAGLSAVGGINQQSVGAKSMTVHGARMGTVGYTGRSRAGRSGCESTEWVSETSVRCRVGQAVAGSRQSVMTVGDRAGSLTEAWSVDVAGLSAVGGINQQSMGAKSMTVHGARMGTVGYTGRSRAGRSGCESTEWVSETSVRCRVGQAVAGSRQSVMTVGDRAGSLTEAWSVDVAGLSAVGGINQQSVGAKSMTVHGARMGTVGYTGRSRAGRSGCESTEWVSETSVRCRVGQAVAGSRQSVMTVGDRAGSLTEAWSVDVAGLSAVGGINQQSVGAKSMTVHGARMGTVGYTGRSRAGRSGCESTEWVSETSVRCRVGQAVAGSRQSVMTVGDRAGSLTEAWSVDVAGLSAVGGINQQSVGAKSMTVHGARMGTVGYTGRSRAGRSGCESTEWVSETSVRCRVGQAVAGSRQSVMTVGDRAGSLTEAWSVDVAGLSAVGGINQQSMGAKSMTVHGARMGTVGYTGRSRAGRSGCESTEWVSETSVRCRVGQAVAGSRQSVMTVGDRAGSLTEAWSVDVAGLSAVGGINQQSVGAKSMTVHGARMGTVGYTGRSRAGRSGCESTEWVSETSVRCRVGQAVAGSRQSVMTVGDRAGSLTEAWSVDVAGLSAVGGINQQSVGAKSMTVHGARMGTVGYTGRSRAGRSGCESTEWVSETSVRCRVGQTVAGSRQSVMTVGDRAGSLTEAWSVDVAGLSAVGGINQQSVGAKSMTVHGARMGTVGYTGRSRAGKSMRIHRVGIARCRVRQHRVGDDRRSSRELD
jgi:hypothetical protein